MMDYQPDEGLFQREWHNKYEELWDTEALQRVEIQFFAELLEIDFSSMHLAKLLKNSIMAAIAVLYDCL